MNQSKHTIPELSDPSLYINREISLTEFHKRVLALAQDDQVPLLERLRFLTISSAILDEFFEIRVGGLKEQLGFGLSETGPDGLSPLETLRQCREKVLELVQAQYRFFNETLLPDLEREGIILFRRQLLNDRQRDWVRDYFEREYLPVLTPIGLDPAHPFPRIQNKILNFIVSLDGKDAFGRKARAAVVQAPRILPRLVRMPPEIAGVPYGFMMLSSIIHAHANDLFPGLSVKGCDQFKVTRNSDLWIDEEEVEDFLLALKGELPGRRFAKAVRLEVSDSCPEDMSQYLLQQFDLEESDLYRVDGPVNLNRLGELYDHVDRPDLKYAPFRPGLPKKLVGAPDLFAVLGKGEVLLHHPYQSFNPVMELVRQAAHDPEVLAIKLTIYRTGVGAPLGEALLEAARAGKEVTAVIELRARFDEAANIELASRLQEAGATVVYGVMGYKAHAKMILIVRREANQLRRYVHLGTGNYHPGTARAYSDFGLMSGDPQLGADVHALFQQLTGLSRDDRLAKVVQTPFGLHDRILALIAQEAANAREGKEARIVAKMNALIEKKIIRALYEASQAGVKIDLIIRGTCCLRPGVPGVSENIHVRSIVGRFLEHHRIYYFHADGEEITYCSSADWMPRNLFRRVEAAFPLEGKKIRERVLQEGLWLMLEDNCQAWELQEDGSYLRRDPGDAPPLNAQNRLLEKLSQDSH